MRHDLFYDKKSVHIKLKKEIHAALREKLFRHNLTMQDLFQELADMILLDTARSQKIIESITVKKVKAMMETHPRPGRRQIGEFDSETLYNLLEEDERSRSAED